MIATCKAELQHDPSVLWLEIALDHLSEAERIANRLSKLSASDATRSDELQKEFKSSVQAIVATATFFEALYSSTKEREPKRGAEVGKYRYGNVTEQLRQSFRLGNPQAKKLRETLKFIYSLRDTAVHPSAAFSAPQLHPQHKINVPRRFADHCFLNAREAFSKTIEVAKMLIDSAPTRKSQTMIDYSDSLKKGCAAVFLTWEMEGQPKNQSQTMD